MQFVYTSFVGSWNDIIPGPGSGQKKTPGNEGVSGEGSESSTENGKAKRTAEEEGTRANAEEIQKDREDDSCSRGRW